MKPSRNLILALLIGALLAAGCKSTGPAPASPTTTPAGSTQVPRQENTAGLPGQPLMPRATSPAVESLAGEFPAFDGLYWTGEVSVTPLGDGAVRLVTGLPCDNLLAMVSAGEWRVAQEALPLSEQTGLVAVLALLENGDRSALVEVRDHNVVALVPLGEPTPTPDPAFATVPAVGCSGTLQVLARQPVAASGAMEAEGEALQYPLMNGCAFFGDSASVKLFYEGPGDLRAMVDFTVPNAVGEYSVDEVDFSLQMMHSQQRFVEAFADAYAAAAAGGDNEDLWGEEFFPDREDAGTVTVTSTDPLVGEFQLQDFISEGGEQQSFRAIFTCP